MGKILTAIILTMLCGSANAAAIKDAGDLANYVGKTVTVKGVVSGIMWQHIMAWPKGYDFETYLDIGKSQTVIYSKEKIDCKGGLEVTGKVILVASGPDRPGERTKCGASGGCGEYHIAADKWECGGAIDILKALSSSGPLPPEYQWEEKLTVRPDHATSTLGVHYKRITGCEGCSGNAKAKVEVDSSVTLKGAWFKDYNKLANELTLCKLGEEPKDIRIGGGEERISITGGHIGALVKTGKRPDGGDVTFKEHNLCSKNKAWWGEFWGLRNEMSKAAKYSSKKVRPLVYRFYHAASKDTDQMVDIRPNYLTRSAVVTGAHVVKSLDTEGLRKFEGLAAGVNYYSEGEIKDEAKLRSFAAGELFFDRGDGTFFSFKNGIADPSGREGAAKALRDYYYYLNGAR